jgi:hypothetical protein
MYVGNDMHRDIFGAREAGLTTVMFDSDQGKKAYRDCGPDYTNHQPPGLADDSRGAGVTNEAIGADGVGRDK